jgi:squalene synthase HpnC
LRTSHPSADVAQVLDDIASRSAHQMRTENFPVALRLLPARPRAQLTRVYAFARFVDDVGDTAPGDRLELLDVIDAQVRGLGIGTPALAPVAGLRPLLDECAVPIAPFLALIEANRVDQRVSRYETFDDLLGYCALSAAPIGQIVLYIAGAAHANNIADSDAACAALQVLEHCQDVGEDAHAGRVYLPSAELRAAGVTDADLVATATSAAVRGVIAAQVDRSRTMLVDSSGLVRRLSGWSRLAVSGYLAGGLATASALRAADYDVLARSVIPTKRRTLLHAVRLAVGG